MERRIRSRGKLVHSWTLDNFETLVNVPVYRTIALRTIGIAAAVTVTDAMLAVPFAFFAVRIAPKRLQAALFVAVLIPLWSSYLVRVYVWRLILAKDGDPELVRSNSIGLGLGQHRLLELGDVDRVQLHLAAVHDPAGLGGDRACARLLHRGLGRPRRARLAHVPHGALAADPARASPPARSSPSRSRWATSSRRRSSAAPARRSSATSSTRTSGVANNVPFAAAFATVPLVVMGIYLLIARRLGAFEAL